MNAICSKGWPDRCRKSKGRKCRCKCGGQNHGGAPKQMSLMEALKDNTPAVLTSVKAHQRIRHKLMDSIGTFTEFATFTDGESKEGDEGHFICRISKTMLTPKPFLITGNAETREVYIGTTRLDPAESQAIVNHSPDGFSWGYGGSGCAQLALAIMLKFYDRETALKDYHAFKWCVIAKLDIDSDFQIPFSLTETYASNNS